MKYIILLFLLFTHLTIAFHLEIKQYKGFYLRDGIYLKRIETSMQKKKGVWLRKLSIGDTITHLNVDHPQKIRIKKGMNLPEQIHLLSGTKCLDTHKDKCVQIFTLIVKPNHVLKPVKHDMILQFTTNDSTPETIQGKIEIVVKPNIINSNKRITLNTELIKNKLRIYPLKQFNKKITIKKIKVIYDEKRFDYLNHLNGKYIDNGEEFVLAWKLKKNIKSEHCSFEIEYNIKNEKNQDFWGIHKWIAHYKKSKDFMFVNDHFKNHMNTFISKSEMFIMDTKESTSIPSENVSKEFLLILIQWILSISVLSCLIWYCVIRKKTNDDDGSESDYDTESEEINERINEPIHTKHQYMDNLFFRHKIINKKE